MRQPAAVLVGGAVAVLALGMGAALSATASPLVAPVEGGNFAWRVDGSGTVAVLRDGRVIRRIAMGGRCAVGNMYDAPAHSLPGMLTPLVACRQGKTAAFLVGFAHRGAVTIARYRAPGDCADVTACPAARRQDQWRLARAR